jgi:hypothetical protein
VYSSAPLEKALRVFGKPRVVLHCRASAISADFTAKLVRVRANGAADFICIGIERSAHLFSKSEYAAEKILRWEISLEPTSCLFEKGESVRLEISSSAFPLFDRNPGSDVPSCNATSMDWLRSTHTVFHSDEFPSALYLPLAEDPQ